METGVYLGSRPDRLGSDVHLTYRYLVITVQRSLIHALDRAITLDGWIYTGKCIHIKITDVLGVIESRSTVLTTHRAFPDVIQSNVTHLFNLLRSPTCSTQPHLEGGGSTESHQQGFFPHLSICGPYRTEKAIIKSVDFNRLSCL